MSCRLRLFCVSFSAFALLITLACTASFQPRPMQDVLFQERAQTKSQGNFRVTAAVLSAQESEAVFGFPLYKRGIQPVWLEVENSAGEPTWFLPFSVDPDYFPPLEVAYPYHRTFQEEYNRNIDQYFLANEMGLFVAPNSSRSGFVFTNLDLGTKIFNVDLVGDDNKPKTFTFVIAVPGLIADHQEIEFEKLYAAGQLTSFDRNETEFRKALSQLPCCTTDANDKESGIPFNLIIVGNDENLLGTLIRSGWNETASANPPASSKQSVSADIPQDDRYNPVSQLYYYGRPQDASFRASRAAGLGGKVLRLWLSPMRFEGKSVWVGLVSRDLSALKLSFKDHKIDLDEERVFFIQNLWYAQMLQKFGYVKGSGNATILQPKKVFGDISYITDGYRVVLWLSELPVALNAVESVDWEIPPES